MILRSQKLRHLINSRFSTSLMVGLACLAFYILSIQPSKRVKANSSVPPNAAMQATPTPTPPPYLFTYRVQDVPWANGTYPTVVQAGWGVSSSSNGITVSASGTTTGNSITLNTSVSAVNLTPKRTNKGIYNIIDIYALANVPVVVSSTSNSTLNVNVTQPQYWYSQTSAAYTTPQSFPTDSRNNITVTGAGTLAGGGSSGGTLTIAPSGTAAFPQYPNATYRKVYTGAAGSSVSGGYAGSSSASGTTVFTINPFVPQPPVAVIDGPKYQGQSTNNIYLGEVITLSSFSYDPDDTSTTLPTTPNIGIVSYAWKVTKPSGGNGGPPLTFPASDASISIACSQEGQYRAELIVTDNEGVSSPTAVKTFDVKAPSVSSVDFIAKDSPLDINPNNGGGYRIYPDKRTPNEPVNRRIVTVQVGVDGRAGTPYTVFLKAFDIDDPSDDAPRVNPEKGDDNFGNGQSLTAQSILDGTAILTVNGGSNNYTEFTVSLQPGDNFVIAASLDRSYLNTCIAEGSPQTGSGIIDATGLTLPSPKATTSPMLTVWRIVNIEVDAFDKVGTNHTDDVITHAENPDETGTVITLGGTIDTRSFENGLLIIGNNERYRILWGIPGKIKLQYRMDDAQISSLNSTQTPCILYDDDHLTDFPGDEDQEIPLPSRDHIETAFKPAYITPAYTISNPTPKCSKFILNMPGESEEQKSHYCFDNVAYSSTYEDYWVVYVLAAYQPRLSQDGDPNDEISDNLVGMIMGSTDFSELTGDSQGFTVFMECLREAEALGYDPKLVPAHELGHVFAGDRTHASDGSLMSSENGGADFNLDWLLKIRKKRIP